MIQRLKYLLPVLALSVAAPLHGDDARSCAIEWLGGYYYNATAKVTITCTGGPPGNAEAVIEAWSRPPIGKSRKVAERRVTLDSPKTIVDLRLRFDLDDYIRPEEAEAAVAAMDIENEEEREQMIVELLPGGGRGVYEQLYYLKLVVNGEILAESDDAFVQALPLY